MRALRPYLSNSRLKSVKETQRLIATVIINGEITKSSEEDFLEKLQSQDGKNVYLQQHRRNKTSQRLNLNESSVLTASSRDISLVSQKGSIAYDINNTPYIDGSGGIGVKNLGGNPPQIHAVLLANIIGLEKLISLTQISGANRYLSKDLIDSINKLAGKEIETIAHVSATHGHPTLERVSAKYANLLGVNHQNNKVDWKNSGTEANELALKAAFAYQENKGNIDKIQVLSTDVAFAGRASFVAHITNKDQYGPRLVGVFHKCKYNDIEDFKHSLDHNPNIGVFIFEPIVGEGGVIAVNPEYLKKVKEICDEREIVVIVDEVQSFMKTNTPLALHHSKLGGKDFAFKYQISTFAKAAGAGVYPVSGVIISNNVASKITGKNNDKIFKSGNTHSGIVPGLLIAEASLEEYQKIVTNPEFSKKCELLDNLLNQLIKSHPDMFKSTSGVDFFRAIQLDQKYDNDKIVKKLREKGLLTMPCGNNGIRFTPALNIEPELLNDFFLIIDKACHDIKTDIALQRNEFNNIVTKYADHYVTHIIVNPGSYYNNPNNKNYDKNAATKFQEYIQTRYLAFKNAGFNYYNEQNPSAYDLYKDAIFILLEDKNSGKIIAGRRILVHEKNSELKFFEEDNCHTTMQAMLPHIDNVKQYKYLELSSISVRPEFQGKGLTDILYKLTYSYYDAIDADFAIAAAVEGNIQNFIKKSQLNGCEQIAYRHDVRGIEDGSGDSIIFVSKKSEDQFPLLSEEHKKAGIGKPPSQAQIEEFYEHHKNQQAERNI